MAGPDELLTGLGVDLPVLAAPMAGGPGTPDLVVAAASAGSLGFVAAAYRSAEQLAEQVADVRRRATTYGVNVFAPNPLPVDPLAYRAYRDELRADADLLGVELPAEPLEDDDHWRAKVELLLDQPVPVVSFTFAVPDVATVQAFQRAGTVVLQTVTSLDEVRQAGEARVDGLVVQSADAGAHYGTFTPQRPATRTPLPELVTQARSHSGLPIVAAGGIGSPADVVDVVRAGASAVMVGTLLLRSDESGASATHRAALAEERGSPVVTRAFTGRPARGLPNTFITAHEASAPLGYPAVNHLTSALRRAAAAAGDPERLHLWAGTGYRAATDEPVATILTRLAGDL